MIGINTALARVDALSRNVVKRASMCSRASAVAASRCSNAKAVEESLVHRFGQLETLTADKLVDLMVMAHRVGVETWHRNRFELAQRDPLKKATGQEKKALRALYESIARGTTATAMSQVRDVMLKNVMDVVADRKEKSYRRQLRMKGPESVLETVALTQTAIAFNAAAWVEGADDNEIWGYELSTAGDERVRDSHIAMDGARYPKGHEFWTSYAPPNGYRCRCSLIPILKGDRRARLKPMKGTPDVDAMFMFNPGILVGRVL